MDGFIRIDKSIRNHWIWKNPIKFQWFIDLLILASHETTTVEIGNNTVECERGQVVISLGELAKMWNTTKDIVRNFLRTLSTKNLIRHGSDTEVTRITICEFEKYDTFRHDTDTVTTRKPTKVKSIKSVERNQIKQTIDDCIENQEPQKSPAFLKFESWVKKDAPRVALMKQQLTQIEFDRLVKEYNKNDIAKIILNMHNYTDLLKKSVSVNLTIRNWLTRAGINANKNKNPFMGEVQPLYR